MCSLDKYQAHQRTIPAFIIQKLQHQNQKRIQRVETVFTDSGSGLNVVGLEKMLRDVAEFIKEVPEGLEVIDFSGNVIEILG